MGKRISLNDAAKRVLMEVLGARPSEKIAVITDFSESMEIARAIAIKANELGMECIVFSFCPKGDNIPLPEHAKEIVNDADCIILLSKGSLSFSPDVWRAIEEGKRVVSCPRISLDMFRRALSVDLMRLSEDTRRVAETLSFANKAMIVTGVNSEATLDISSRRAVYVDGLATRPSSFTIIPGGIVGIAPLEGSTNGEIVINGSVSHLGPLRKPIKLTIERGEIVEISGGRDAKRLERLLEGYGSENMYKIAELGVGVHPMMRVRGNATEDESSRGTIVIGIGENSGHLGGKIDAPDHVDLFIRFGSLFLDRIPLVIGGNLLLGEAYEKGHNRREG
ncbi:MAG: hypothetical protein DRN30_03825 [Thermoplasmata archaeon]|nr:MAG: hypothetical protein DRN30_03825 [Thermoplasmata archaeon]